MRNSYLFVIVVIDVFLIWYWYDYVVRQKTGIEVLTPKVQKLEPTIDVVEIKNKVETTTTVETNYNDMTTIKDTHISYNCVFQCINTIDFSEIQSMKTILIWTEPDHDPLKYLKNKNDTFVKRKCRVKNCYIIRDKTSMDITEFDVILFNGPEMLDKKYPNLPPERSPRQNYVFAAIESSDYYPVCNNKFNGYFNISWTYKLNSDIFYGYIIIRNTKGEIIGPQKEMHWLSIDEMKPVNATVKQKLSSKKKLAAWLVSNCDAPNGRNTFARKMQVELKKLNTDMRIDVFGYCGTFLCSHTDISYCLHTFERDYYFYLSFENTFTEDYVTEKLLHSLKHYTVPIVYGIANYSRFMPDGIYLNALELGPEKLVKRMLEIVSDKEQYYSYFKWMNHYSYHDVEEVPESDFFCKFCEAMNDDNLIKRTTVIDNFEEWWNPPTVRREFCPSKF